MLFNSIDFAIFLPTVFFLYWFVTHKTLRIQNALLLVVSYVFYGWWDWRFLSLILFSSFVDYFVGIGLSKTAGKPRRILLLLTSIFVNLGLLGFFKYYNFFLNNFVEAFSFFGHSINPQGLSVILPVGISFYTFQTLSYSIDVYRRKFEPTRDIVAFFAFVAFFPQLVAGPIERASNLLPQFYKKRIFEPDRAVDGMRQILWGLFKKIVIADNCAIFANDVFANYTHYSGGVLVLGAVFFTFQIYGDFSGYSDIAIGVSRLFGFNLTRNFAFPYFSRDIAEFWRRWHISLSSWFRDYVYIPLGGNRGGTWMKIRNVLAVFVLTGFWHGANWTFIVWGALNALYFLPLMLMGKNRTNIETVARGRLVPTVKEVCSIGITFGLTVLAWIFFRAENLGHAFSFISRICSTAFFAIPSLKSSKWEALVTLFIVTMFVIVEWLGREHQHPLQLVSAIHTRAFRWSVYFLIIGVMLVWGGKQQAFIYFQF